MMDRVDTPSVGSILPPGFLDGVGALHQPEKRLIAAVLEGAVGDFQKYATAFNGRGNGCSPTRRSGSSRPPPIGPSISRTSARLSDSTRRSSGKACGAGASRGDGRVHRGPCPLSFRPGERDSSHDLRDAVT